MGGCGRAQDKLHPLHTALLRMSPNLCQGPTDIGDSSVLEKSQN